MNLREKTIETYNESAFALAEYFKGIGARTDDIELALELAGDPIDPLVVEIGCGDGRDASEIVQRTSNYMGFDISTEMVKLAQQKVPSGHFETANAVDFDYPEKADIVFAFASLLHLDRDEVAVVLDRVHKSLRPGGIFYISLKYADEYEERIQEDDFGVRLFYFYNPDTIIGLAGDKFETASSVEGFVTKGTTKWFELALRKTQHSE